jgi:hypothetical protein
VLRRNSLNLDEVSRTTHLNRESCCDPFQPSIHILKKLVGESTIPRVSYHAHPVRHHPIMPITAKCRWTRNLHFTDAGRTKDIFPRSTAGLNPPPPTSTTSYKHHPNRPSNPASLPSLAHVHPSPCHTYSHCRRHCLLSQKNPPNSTYRTNN